MGYFNNLCICFILFSTFLITYGNAANWNQYFPKNATRYRKDPEKCSTCISGYGFQYGTYSKCQHQNNLVDIKCPKTTNIDTIEVDCGAARFKCNSGQCIDLDAVCDGNSDCPDHSDEVEQQCSKLNCNNLYRCNYGACVRKSARCNGVKDCFDGSDEELCGDGGTRFDTGISGGSAEKPVIPLEIPNSPLSCVVPTPPPHGKFINSNNPFISLRPGEYLPQFNALITSCDRNYRTTPPTSNYPVCISGKWSSPPLACALYCQSANSSLSTRITCTHGKTQLEGCLNPVEGTIATITCAPLFEGTAGNPTRVCRDGSWDYPIYECRPVCGQKIPKGKPNILGGAIAPKGSYPWHAGIYANDASKRHLCGASILNRRVLISAAHCFSDNDGSIYHKENYLIAAGKYYRVYNEARDDFAQYATIHSIHVPDRFKGGVANYEADIAVVVLANPLRISVSVQPICVDWTTDFEYQQLSDNSYGVVVGWGYTKKGEVPSEELKELNVPYISYDQCFEQVPRDFRKFLTYDKICAGFLYHGVAVCQGDSGGGLAFQRKYNDRFYLRGIVSTSPRSEESCDPDQYATYTLVSRHIDFIKELETLYRL